MGPGHESHYEVALPKKVEPASGPVTCGECYQGSRTCADVVLCPLHAQAEPLWKLADRLAALLNAFSASKWIWQLPDTKEVKEALAEHAKLKGAAHGK